MKHNYRILSFVGGHDIEVYENCCFDKETRKFKGGTHVATIPFSGRVLNAKIIQEDADDILSDGMILHTKTKPIYTDVDAIPGEDVCDYCIVSNLYVVACKELGIDTSRLLTIGGSVADDKGNVIGVCYFNRN